MTLFLDFFSQAKCYLAAMNALHLVDPKNAWIVKPLDRIDTSVSHFARAFIALLRPLPPGILILVGEGRES